SARNACQDIDARSEVSRGSGCREKGRRRDTQEVSKRRRGSQTHAELGAAVARDKQIEERVHSQRGPGDRRIASVGARRCGTHGAGIVRRAQSRTTRSVEWVVRFRSADKERRRLADRVRIDSFATPRAERRKAKLTCSFPKKSAHQD